MDDYTGILAGLALAGVGSYLLYFVMWNGIRFLLPYQPVEIAKARVGNLIYVAGKVGEGTEILSPITKTPCMRWQVFVTETRGSGKSKSTRKVLDRQSLQAFPVRDKTSTIQVLPVSSDSPERVQTSVGPRSMTSGGLTSSDLLSLGTLNYQASQNLFQNLTDPAIAFLEDCNVPLNTDSNWFSNKRPLTLYEYIWQTGTRVYIFGKAIGHDRYGQALVAHLISRDSRSCIAVSRIFWGIVGVFFIVQSLKILYETAQLLF